MAQRHIYILDSHRRRSAVLGPGAQGRGHGTGAQGARDGAIFRLSIPAENLFINIYIYICIYIYIQPHLQDEVKRRYQFAQHEAVPVGPCLIEIGVRDLSLCLSISLSLSLSLSLSISLSLSLSKWASLMPPTPFKSLEECSVKKVPV